MTAKTLSKYDKYTVVELKKKAQIKFNAWIRKRDQDKPCISCGARPEQAGHFYSAGHYDALRFNEDNTNGQCLRCNYYLSGNLNAYRINLAKRIGEERLVELDRIADITKRNRGKNWDRFTLIEIIEKYK